MEVNKKLWSRQSSWPRQRSVVTRLSALNVEELRQEHGMEALKTVSAHFAACMHGQVDRDAGTGEWWEHLPSYVLQTPHITIQVNRRSYLLYKLLQMLCLRIAVECVSSLAVNLQIHFLQSGVLWHLLMTLSQWCKTQWTPSGMRCSTLPLPGSGCTTRFGLQQASVPQASPGLLSSRSDQPVGVLQLSTFSVSKCVVDQWRM